MRFCFYKKEISLENKKITSLYCLYNRFYRCHVDYSAIILDGDNLSKANQ
jgi:hypothetical protein